MTKRNWVIALMFGALLLAVLACGAPASTPAPVVVPTIGVQPTPTLRAYLPPPEKGPQYSIPQISAGAIETSDPIIEGRVMTIAWTTGIAIFILVNAAGIWLAPGWYYTIVLILGLILGNVGYGHYRKQVPALKDTISHNLADTAATDGFDFAQRVQAINEQYIHAVVKIAGMDVVPCASGDRGSRDFCGQNTGYYNHWTTQYACGTDEDGDTEYCDEDHYENWFDQINRYWIVPDTKAKYLDEGYYHQSCWDNGSIVPCARDEYGKINDQRNPVVYLHEDWRAPENTDSHIFVDHGFFGDSKVDVGNYNNHVPNDWAYVRSVSQACGNNYCGGTFVANFVGPYFNYGFASGSQLFDPVVVHYQDLLGSFSLPLPGGSVIQVPDGFGNTITLRTQLTGTDSDLPLHFNPITVVGSCLSEQQLSGYADYAMNLQGDFGPTKQGSLRWFLVCDDVFQKVGGMQNVLTALKAYERDENVWGKFSMPQNLVIVASHIVLTADGPVITERGMETGMPAGNNQVKTDMAASIPQGQALPLTKENLFGTYTGDYISSAESTTKYDETSYGLVTTLGYQYSNLTEAGGAVGILYAKDPDYKAPDPSDPNCELPKTGHHGFIRYSACHNQYLKSNVMVNLDGYNYTMAIVAKSAREAIPVWGGWLFLLFAVIVAFVSFGNKLGSY